MNPVTGERAADRGVGFALEFEGLPPVVGGFTQIPYCMDEPGCL